MKDLLSIVFNTPFLFIAFFATGLSIARCIRQTPWGPIECFMLVRYFHSQT